MKESTKPRIGRMLGDSPSRKMDKVELNSAWGRLDWLLVVGCWLKPCTAAYLQRATKARAGLTNNQQPGQTSPALRTREKIAKSGTDSPFRTGQLRIFKRLRGAKKVSGPGLAIF